jgi:hypothetical protein
MPPTATWLESRCFGQVFALSRSIRSPHLANVFQAKTKTPFLDDANGEFGFSVLGQLADMIESAMNPTCASNVVSLLCHAAFKECKPVGDGSTENQRRLPSLLCRSECNKHWEIWNTCLKGLGLETQMRVAVHCHVLLCTWHTFPPIGAWRFTLFVLTLLQVDGACLDNFYQRNLCPPAFPPTFCCCFLCTIFAFQFGASGSAKRTRQHPLAIPAARVRFSGGGRQQDARRGQWGEKLH